MGYTPPRTLYKLDFSQTEHAGLEVTARSMSVDGLLRLLDLAGSAEASGKDAEELIDRFAVVLADWNVEDDDGQPVPATAGGLLSQEISFVVALITAYCQAMTQAPPPLPTSSPAAGSSPEGLIELASQSQSPPS